MVSVITGMLFSASQVGVIPFSTGFVSFAVLVNTDRRGVETIISKTHFHSVLFGVA